MKLIGYEIQISLKVRRIRLDGVLGEAAKRDHFLIFFQEVHKTLLSGK